MAKMIQVPYQSDIIVPVETAQSVQSNRENPISLEALGLLVNLLSYPTTWELHKTELYKRFANHGERSVKSAWNSLLDANYIIEFKYRVGRKWEYVYYFRKVPFTAEEKAEILDSASKEYGEITSLKFEDCKMKTPKRRGNQKPLLKQVPELNTIKHINTINDDDKRTPSQESHELESINNLISNFREATKDDLTERSFRAVIRKVMDKYNQNAIGEGKLRDYMSTSLANKIVELELRKAKDRAKVELLADKQNRIKERTEQIQTAPTNPNLPFYNWLE